MILNDAPRSSQRKPFGIIDVQASGPPLWSFNMITDTPGTDAILQGAFVDGNGLWHKFTAINASDEVKSLRKMCQDSSFDWSDDYLGLIVTYLLNAGIYYCVGSPYDTTEATPSGSAADDVSCPHIIAADYRTNPIIFGRVFSS